MQVIEIPPGGKTRWHSYGYNGEPLMLGLSGRGQTEFYSPMFVILRGSGYDLWSAATDLAAYEADVKAGRTHKASYKEGGLCGVPAGPHWHQHFRVGDEPVRWLAIVPRGSTKKSRGVSSPSRRMTRGQGS